MVDQASRLGEDPKEGCNEMRSGSEVTAMKRMGKRQDLWQTQVPDLALSTLTVSLH